MIEDDDAIRYTLGLILDSTGYSIVFADNGQEALQQLASSSLPDLILLDMLMPLMDGWTFASRFHARYGHAVPIIVMTAASDPGQRSREIDAEGCVSKPFAVEVLLAEINRVLDNRYRRKAA